MSYGIVRIQKMTSGSVKGIEIHDLREKEGLSHTNKDIDWSKTKENYSLHPKQDKSFYKAVKERIDSLNLPKAVRKDAIVMSQVLVTSDREFFDGLTHKQQKEFFQRSYNFLKARYGAENVISATVHLDEKTPHMHFNFVPVTDNGRLSAKTIFTRQSLIDQQDKFHVEVGKKYNLERGERGGVKTHLEVAEYKARTSAQQVKQLQEEIYSLKSKKTALESSIMPVPVLEAIKPEKTLTGTIKGISMDEISLLKNAARAALFLKDENTALKKENADLKSRIPSMNDRIKNAQQGTKIFDLEKENELMRAILHRNNLLRELMELMRERGLRNLSEREI